MIGGGHTTAIVIHVITEVSTRCGIVMLSLVLQPSTTVITSSPCPCPCVVRGQGETTLDAGEGLRHGHAGGQHLAELQTHIRLLGVACRHPTYRVSVWVPPRSNSAVVVILITPLQNRGVQRAVRVRESVELSAVHGVGPQTILGQPLEVLEDVGLRGRVGGQHGGKVTHVFHGAAQHVGAEGQRGLHRQGLVVGTHRQIEAIQAISEEKCCQEAYYLAQ